MGWAYLCRSHFSFFLISDGDGCPSCNISNKAFNYKKFIQNYSIVWDRSFSQLHIEIRKNVMTPFYSQLGKVGISFVYFFIQFYSISCPLLSIKIFMRITRTEKPALIQLITNSLKLCSQLTQSCQIYSFEFSPKFAVFQSVSTKTQELNVNNFYLIQNSQTILIIQTPIQGFMKISCMIIIHLAISQINTGYLYHYEEDILLPTSFYKCFRSQGFSDVDLMFYSEGFGQKNLWEQITNIYNAKNAGLQVSVFFIPCPVWDIEKEIQSLLKYFSSTVITRFWVFPSIQNKMYDPRCGLDSISPHESCLYLQNLIRAFRNKNLDANLVSRSSDWIQLFGQLEGCPELGNTLLWWVPEYQKRNNQQNFEDYLKFGGWNKPLMKLLQSKQNVCGQQFYVSYYRSQVQA